MATEDGLLAFGGDLSLARLLDAYRHGIFPWYNEDEPILWWSPSPRMVVYPERYKPAKSLKQTIRKQVFDVKADTRFEQVIHACGDVPRQNQYGTWLTDEMRAAYINLHQAGYAHSFEAYQNGKLVGGLYGVSLGKAFFGESMFHIVSDASKVAFYYLTAFCRENGFLFIDAQQDTSHIRSLGGVLISRDDFLSLLSQSNQAPSLKGKWNIKNLAI
jgi:leucyl/phenylalanyl-tRNA--protein transferase